METIDQIYSNCHRHRAKSIKVFTSRFNPPCTANLWGQKNAAIHPKATWSHGRSTARSTAFPTRIWWQIPGSSCPSCGEIDDLRMTGARCDLMIFRKLRVRRK